MRKHRGSAGVPSRGVAALALRNAVWALRIEQPTLQEGALRAKTGAVTAVQRTSSDLRLNPHLHTIALDGAWHEQGNELVARGQAARSLLALDI